MTLDDLPGVLEIERQSFPTPWSEASFRHELLENPYANLFVVRLPRGPGVAGYSSVWVVDRELRINNIAVHPGCRRRGIGTRLLEFLLRHGALHGCSEATLEVRPGNETALRIYEKAGFKPVGRRKNYYADTQEDALVMSRPLTGHSGAGRP